MAAPRAMPAGDLGTDETSIHTWITPRQAVLAIPPLQYLSCPIRQSFTASPVGDSDGPVGPMVSAWHSFVAGPHYHTFIRRLPRCFQTVTARFLLPVTATSSFQNFGLGYYYCCCCHGVTTAAASKEWCIARSPATNPTGTILSL